MGAVYGYVRGGWLKRVPRRAEQVARIAGYLDARGLPFDEARQLFADRAEGRVRDFGDRPAGGALWGRLRRGDHVVAASLDRMFARSADFALTVAAWERLGVTLHSVELGGRVQDLGAVALAGAIADLERVALSEAAAWRAARSRHFRRPVNGTSPYGFAWERRPGGGVWELVPDAEERYLMGEMLRLYEGGQSIDAIRQHLAYELKAELWKKKGRGKHLIRWTNDSVWRRIKAEQRLRASEAAGLSSRGVVTT